MFGAGERSAVPQLATKGERGGQGRIEVVWRLCILYPLVRLVIDKIVLHHGPARGVRVVAQWYGSSVHHQVPKDLWNSSLSLVFRLCSDQQRLKV